MKAQNISLNNSSMYNYNNKIRTDSVSSSDRNKQVSAPPAPVEKENEAAKVGVEFVKSERTQSTTYNKKAALDYIEQAKEQQMSSFKSMVSGLLNKQGINYNTTTLPDMSKILKNKDIEAAKKAIEDGGAYSVGSVTDRIMNMAQTLAKGDSSKIEELKGAVEKGFGMAKKLFGQDMPEITDKTYDSVMKEFEKWEKDPSYKKEPPVKPGTELQVV